MSAPARPFAFAPEVYAAMTAQELRAYVSGELPCSEGHALACEDELRRRNVKRWGA